LQPWRRSAASPKAMRLGSGRGGQSIMAKNDPVKIGILRESELDEASRIMRLAFGTFLGLPDPMQFMGDREMLRPRWRARNTRFLAARVDGRLVGTNVLTRWGSFGFFGPLTVLPEYWDKGVARRLMENAVKVFDGWGVRHSGLFTFPHSAKHIGLYNKSGYWPGYLTALMKHTPTAKASNGNPPVLLSTLKKSQREEAIKACARLTGRIDKGLDLSEEIRAALTQGAGDVVLAYTRSTLDAFALCLTGPGSEGGAKLCYVKFGAARTGDGAGARFDRLLDAVDEFALARGIEVEAGVSLARRDAFTRMRGHGFRTMMQGVALHRPHGHAFNRADVYVMDDWR
jgi:GNAT superfamily N-acetyltransferase